MLPPFRGTNNNHWELDFSNFSQKNSRLRSLSLHVVHNVSLFLNAWMMRIAVLGKHTSWEKSSSSCLPNAMTSWFLPMWFRSIWRNKHWYCEFSTCRSFSKKNMTYPFYISCLSNVPFKTPSFFGFRITETLFNSRSDSMFGRLSWLHWAVEGIVPLGGSTWKVHITTRRRVELAAKWYLASKCEKPKKKHRFP